MCDINKEYKEKLAEAEKGCDNIINEMKEKMKDDNPFRADDWFNKKVIKNKDIIFIFACPGKEEFIKDKPCAGQTGTNLNDLINLLSAEFTKIFNEKDRYCYVILNSSDKVHFNALTGDSEPSETEISKKVQSDILNKRKKSLLQKAKLIFCFGKKARYYYNEITKEFNKKEISICNCVECCHLGNQALNCEYKVDENKYKTSKERREKRIELLFEEIRSKIIK